MSWIQVGPHHFDLLNPRPSQISLDQIIPSIFRIPRFLGHTSRPWTVGDHSIAVAKYLEHINAPASTILLGLLHDAHEAFIGDIPSPLKGIMEVGGKPFKEVEAKLQYITESALIPIELYPTSSDREQVAHADLCMLEWERREFLPLCETPWAYPAPSFPFRASEFFTSHTHNHLHFRFRYTQLIQGGPNA